MIKVDNLSKTYITKDNIPVKALDNISLNLPDYGMVFICGKSGSGKSTLLNILASLDNFDEGTIFVDGNNLNELDESLYDSYRSTLIGNIFQDFHLINNLTVQENVELALDIINEKDKNIVSNILNQVGLYEYKNRFPKELSGGEKQRVAIARCLVKKPKYIFADEPTGNLDYNTSIQILDLLKTLSKERLILIVSHSKQNAYKYGDRIIEIESGKIIKDVEKHPETSFIEDDTIYLPTDTILSNEEIKEVNEKISTGKFKISQENNSFKPTPKIDVIDTYYKLDVNNKFNIKRIIYLSKTFRRNYLLPTIFNALIISLLLISLLIAQLFFNFNSSDFINSQSDNEMDFVLYKESSSKNFLTPITNEDINYFYNNGYTGNISKLYSYNIPTGEFNHVIDDKYCICWNKSISFDLTKNPFIIAGKGVLECNIDYLTRIYGINGKLDLLAGSLDDSGKCELIITDYFADCLQYYRNMNYKEIVEIDKIVMDLSKYRVKAIINTNYKERYSELLTKYQDLIFINDSNIHEQEIEKLKESDMYINFYNELNTYLSVAYFIDGNFINRLQQDRDLCWNSWTINPKFYDSSNNQLFGEQGIFSYMIDEEINPGEVRLGTAAFSKIFGYDYNDAKFPLELTITDRYLSNNGTTPDFEKTFKVVGVFETDALGIHLAPDDFFDIYDIIVMNYGLYFENTIQAKNIFNNDKNLKYYTFDTYFNALHDVNNIIIIFKDIFKIINYGILLIIAILLVNYGRNIIKSRLLEIGILRANGAKTKDIFVIILSQVLLMLIFVVLISIAPILSMDKILNNILLEGFMNYSESRILENIVIIKFDLLLVLQNFLLILSLTGLCSSFLIFNIRKVKPINIIKKDE